MADVKGTLPPFVSRGRVMGALLDSAQGELEALEREARAAARRMAAGTADEKGLALWEDGRISPRRGGGRWCWRLWTRWRPAPRRGSGPLSGGCWRERSP